MKKVFVTGATGYLGSHLIKQLARKSVHVVALIRSGSKTEGLESNYVKFVEGDLGDHTTYQDLLNDCDAVIHCAALVGVESRDENFKVNFEGSKEVIKAMHHASVKHCIFISSISSGFPKRSHYAESKRKAEREFLLSGIPTTVLRINLIIGKESPMIEKIAGLALKLPIVPVVGSGQKLIQPIDVNDVVTVIMQSLANSKTRQQTYVVSGKDQVTFDTLLDGITQAKIGKKKMKFHIPIFGCNLIAAVLSKVSANPPISKGQIILINQDAISNLEDLQKSFSIEPKTLKSILSEVS